MQINDSTLNEYKTLLEKKLKPERYIHSLNVADGAEYLAKKYGASQEKAYFAGLMHDVMKNASAQEQLEILKKDSVELSACEMSNQKLWHAMAGASYLKIELGFSDRDFLDSVRYHTTGRAGMSLLEKIIYIADFNSAERTYKDVGAMRKLADNSLESAMLFALKFSISNLAKEGKTIHPDSLHCYNETVLNNKLLEV